MTVYKVLADIVDALRATHLEHEAIRQEMATKTEATRAEMATKRDLAALESAMRREFAAVRAEMATKRDLAALESAMRGEFAAVRAETATKEELGKVARGLEKLGLEFEAFRHDTKITLEMISELMARTGRHEKDISSLNSRTSRIENHLKLKPLPDGAGDE